MFCQLLRTCLYFLKCQYIYFSWLTIQANQSKGTGGENFATAWKAALVHPRCGWLQGQHWTFHFIQVIFRLSLDFNYLNGAVVFVCMDTTSLASGCGVFAGIQDRLRGRCGVEGAEGGGGGHWGVRTNSILHWWWDKSFSGLWPVFNFLANQMSS